MRRSILTSILLGSCLLCLSASLFTSCGDYFEMNSLEKNTSTDSVEDSIIDLDSSLDDNDNSEGDVNVESIGLEYVLNPDGNSYSVAGIGTCKDTKIVIPEKYEGKIVTNIYGLAFDECTHVTEISIPETITSIDASNFKDTAFYNDENNWENGVLYIGNYLIKANTSFSGRCNVNEGIKILADEAFSGCYNLRSVDISSSVERIGKSAFANCSSLEYINFQYENKLEKICEKAFKSCKSLLRINYSKSKAEWADVTKDIDWDYQTGNYIVHCTDGDIPK